MVGFPAARLGDPHTCPMCMGATLPVIPPCAVTVMIGKKPAARMTDLCSCVAPIPVPVDMIIFGSPTVLICGLPASRQFDPTVKGGLILMGEPSVMIGIVATPAPGAPGGLNVWEETLADGSVVTHVGANITIKGSKAFRDAVVRDLQRLDATPTGHDLLQSLNAPDFQESSGVLAAWFERMGCQAALVRPDHYVYGAFNTAQDLKAALQTLEL